jgi:hypothetical protein
VPLSFETGWIAFTAARGGVYRWLNLIFIHGEDWKKLIDSPACYDLIAERRAKDQVDELKTELKRLIDAARDGAKAAEDARQAEVSI